MSAIEIWSNGDRMPRSSKSVEDLRSFRTYRKTHLIGKIKHDNAQFLSNRKWADVPGKAWKGTICGSASVAVNEVDYNIIGMKHILENQFYYFFYFLKKGFIYRLKSENSNDHEQHLMY